MELSQKFMKVAKPKYWAGRCLNFSCHLGRFMLYYAINLYTYIYIFNLGRLFKTDDLVS